MSEPLRCSLGEPVAAQDAVAWGMANKCVPLAALDEEARQVALRLAAKPAISLQATKNSCVMPSISLPRPTWS